MSNKVKIVSYWVVVGVLAVVLISAILGIIIAQWRFIKAEFEIGNPKEHPNYAGVLKIEAVDIEVPLVQAYRGEEQSVVDKGNCAAEMVWRLGAVPSGDKLTKEDYAHLIGDHRSQEFKTLVDCKEDDKAIIKRPDGTVEEYKVVKVFSGENTRSDLVDGEGKSVLNQNKNGIILYTCLDSTEIPVFFVFLQPLG